MGQDVATRTDNPAASLGETTHRRVSYSKHDPLIVILSQSKDDTPATHLRPFDNLRMAWPIQDRIPFTLIPFNKQSNNREPTKLE